MYGLIRAIDAQGSAREVGLGPWTDADGSPRIVTDRQRSGWAAAQLFMVGKNGAHVADAWLTSADLRTLAARAVRIAEWLENKRTRACACDDGRHWDMIDRLCPQLVNDRGPYCGACWTPEYGMTQHDRAAEPVNA